MTLDETYERILLGIDRERREHTIRLLQCLAFSRRPLHVKELAEVLAIQFDTAIPRLDASLRPGNAGEAVLSACSTLVTTVDGYDYFDYNTRVVQFSHYSVKEFLTSERLANSDKRDLSQYYISPKPANTILAHSCISTLLQPDIHIRDITDNLPLAKYAAQNWFHHARYNGVACQIQDGMERLFDPDEKHFAKWISIHNIDGPWSLGPSRHKASPLYYAALCGIGSLVEYLLVSRHQDPNESHGIQGTPLRVAVVSGHTMIARLLLDHTAHANDWNMEINSLLCVAVERGNLDIARLLLNHGADLNSPRHHGCPLLHTAVRSQRLDIVEFVLNGGANVNVWSIMTNSRTPLHVAAESGNSDIVRLLLNYGANINTLDNMGASPLHGAVRSQKLDVVELLLNGGADVNVRAHYRTPLHLAADSGNFDIVRLLLSHGADVNAFSCRQDSPLHSAIRLQTLDGVELLLKGGADVNARGYYYRTPLHLAALKGSLDISRLLIENGAVIDAKDDGYQTPFSIALAYGHRKLARFLSNDRSSERDDDETPVSFVYVFLI
jgi:ankyrin repeat protein